MKAMKSEIKEKVQETNSDRKETGTHINDLEQKEEINIQPEQNEETRIQKNEERTTLHLERTFSSLGTSRASLNVPTSESQGCQRRRGRANN